MHPDREPLALDHLLYATPDVDATVVELEQRFGVGFRQGGRHPAWGTRNRILPLGNRLYLEVIGPDPSSPAPDGGRILDLDRLERPSLRWWAVRPFLLPLTCDDFETAGYVPGEIIQGHRELEGGGELGWQMTDPHVRLLDGLLPLVIDWGVGSSHPGDDVTGGVTLMEFRLEHPDHEQLTPVFGHLRLQPVHPGETPALIARFDTPNGPVELRS
jgi:hypothetical protein